jgi:hypothetical protein
MSPIWEMFDIRGSFNCDIQPLCTLPDHMIGNYYPGDTAVILVSQPASLTISPRYMVRKKITINEIAIKKVTIT